MYLSISLYIYIHIHTNLPVNAIVQLTHSWSRDSMDQKTFLALSTEKETRNYDTRVLKPPSFPISTKVKGTELYQDEMVSHISKFTSKYHSHTTPYSEGR